VETTWDALRPALLRGLPFLLAVALMASVLVVLQSQDPFNNTFVAAWVVLVMAAAGLTRLGAAGKRSLGSFRAAPGYGAVATVAMLALSISWSGGYAGGEGGVPGLSPSFNSYLIRAWARSKGGRTVHDSYTLSLLRQVQQGSGPGWGFFNITALAALVAVVLFLSRAWLIRPSRSAESAPRIDQGC
jgi:hypothetical protein